MASNTIVEEVSTRLHLSDEKLRARDHELESLRDQLARLKEELDAARAECDYHKTASAIKENRQTALKRRRTSVQGEPEGVRLDIDHALGEARATRVQDPRIGRPRRILVIGGGPAGLITLHEMLNPVNRPEGESLEEYDIQLYERRAEVGGVWYFEPENDIAKGWHQGSAGWHIAPREQEEKREEKEKEAKLEKARNLALESAGDMEMMYTTQDWLKSISRTNSSNSSVTSDDDSDRLRLERKTSSISDDFCYLHRPQAPRWPSPAYEGLVGNVLPPLIEFAAHPMPKLASGLFPSMVETHNYLLGLAGPLRSHIHVNQEITSVKPVYKEGRAAPVWQVRKVDWSEDGQGAEDTEEWDAVIACAGAFDHPWFPNMKGLKPYLDARSSLIMHAKTYPGPRPFVNQTNKIVIVGNANSANDIAAHLAPLNTGGPIYRCIRHASNFAHLPDSRIKDVRPIASIDSTPEEPTLTITLEDGVRIKGVTKLIFASGYQYTFPWLHVPNSTTKPTTSSPPQETHTPSLCNVSKYGSVPYLHQGTFHAGAPTLALIGLGQGSAPMPTAEIQARLASRIFHNVAQLPGIPPSDSPLPAYADAASLDALTKDFRARAETIGGLDDADPDNWRMIHMIRGKPELTLLASLVDAIEVSEEGASAGLFRWDDYREGVAKNMRAVKESELRRLRNLRVGAGGVDGGVGGVLAVSGSSTSGPYGSSAKPVEVKDFKRGMAVGL